MVIALFFIDNFVNNQYDAIKSDVIQCFLPIRQLRHVLYVKTNI